MSRPEDSDLKYAAFFAHLGLLFGFLAVILMLYSIYVALAPSGAGSGALLFPMLAWFVGLMFVLGKYFEIRRPD